MRASSHGSLIALLVVVASPCGLRAEPMFDAPYRYFPTSAPVHAVVAGHLGARTRTFALVSHTDEMSVELLETDNGGDLRSSAIIPVSSHPHGLALADFDGDGCPDVVVGGFSPPGIVLIHGRCGGTFDRPVFFPNATAVERVTVDDIDADGYPDVVGWSSEGAAVMLGDERGGLLVPIPVPDGSLLAAVGRIDADAYPDVGFLRPGEDSLTIRFGRGDGTFANDRTIECGGVQPVAPSFVDLNGDGHLDILYGLDEAPFVGGVGARINDGDGNFAEPSTCVGGGGGVGGLERSPSVIAGGDVDGDGHADAVAISASPGGPVMDLILGNGCGRFRGTSAHDVQSFGAGTFADLDGDGADDFLQPDGSGVAVFTSSAAGRFGQETLGLSLDSGGGPLVVGHFRDGQALNLAVPEYSYERFDILFGSGGGFGPEQWPGSIAGADLDLDGHQDVVVSAWPHAATTSIALTHNGSPTEQDLEIGGVVGVVRAGGDPHPEVLILEPDSLIALRDRGDGSFEPAHTWAGGGNQLVVCDLNADGLDDVVVRDGSSLSVRLGGPSGLSTEAVTAATVIGGKIQMVDVDGDGRLDIFDGFGGAPQWRRGHGDGTFDAPAHVSLPAAPDYALADWNGDGLIDAAWLARKVGVAFGMGGGSFSAPRWFGTGFAPTQIAAGDFTGDGRPDIAVLDNSETPHGDVYGMLDLLVNTIPAGTLLDAGGKPTPASTTFAIGIPAPNPLRSETRLRLSTGRARQVSVRVLDVAGREVRVLRQGALPAGDQEVVWDGRDARGLPVPPGIYLVNARDETASIARRVVVLR